MKINFYKWFSIFMIILFIGGLVYSCQERKDHKKELLKEKQNTIALISDFEKKLKDKDTIFIGKVVEAQPKDIIKTELFNELDSATQAQLKKLAAYDKLLAAFSAKLDILAQTSESQAYDTQYITLTDTTISFKKGTIFVFQDTTGSYTYDEKLTFADSLKRDFKSNLTLNPMWVFTRNKDNSIDGEMSFGDTDGLSINSGNTLAFYVPGDPPQSKAKKITLETLKWTARIGVPCITYYAGFKTGVSVTK